MNIDTLGMLQLTPQDMMGQLVAVLGIRGSGKSNTAAVLMEELLEAGVPVQIIDIAGEYYTLKQRYPHVTVVGRGIYNTADIAIHSGNSKAIARKSYQNGASVVIDVSGMPSEPRLPILLDYLTEIWNESVVHRVPTVIFLEEAHNWIPQRGKTDLSPLLVDIACEGRKRGLSMVMIGQRSARIDKDVLTQADLAFLHRVRHPSDMKVYQEIMARNYRQTQMMVTKLKPGAALVLEGERVTRYQMRLRHTEHVGTTPTIDDAPKSPMSLLDLMGG